MRSSKTPLIRRWTKWVKTNFPFLNQDPDQVAIWSGFFIFKYGWLLRHTIIKEIRNQTGFQNDFAK